MNSALLLWSVSRALAGDLHFAPQSVVTFHNGSTLGDFSGTAQIAGFVDPVARRGMLDIPTASLSTGSGPRDARMLAYCLEVPRFPTIHFAVTTITGDVAALKAGGPAGTVTPLHHDTCNVFFVQIHGRKRFHFAPPTETDLLADAQAMYAGADPEHPERTPGLSIPYASAEVGPGDVLFIPVGWWHHVRALDTSISVALAGFTRPNWFDWYRPGSVK